MPLLARDYCARALRRAGLEPPEGMLLHEVPAPSSGAADAQGDPDGVSPKQGPGSASSQARGPSLVPGPGSRFCPPSHGVQPLPGPPGDQI